MRKPNYITERFCFGFKIHPNVLNSASYKEDVTDIAILGSNLILNVLLSNNHVRSTTLRYTSCAPVVILELHSG